MYLYKQPKRNKYFKNNLYTTNNLETEMTKVRTNMQTSG